MVVRPVVVVRGRRRRHPSSTGTTPEARLDLLQRVGRARYNELLAARQRVVSTSNASEKRGAGRNEDQGGR